MYVQPDKYVQAVGLFISGFYKLKKQSTRPEIKVMNEETGA